MCLHCCLSVCNSVCMQMPLEADLQRRYRELQLRYHPDKNGDGSGDMAALLNQARCLFLSVHLCLSCLDFFLSVVGPFLLSLRLFLSIFPFHYVPSSRYIWSSAPIFVSARTNKRHHHIYRSPSRAVSLPVLFTAFTSLSL